MPFSNGVFTRVYNWVNDKNANIDITASRFDTEDDGFATGLSTCVLKDGTQTMTANIPFAGFKITGYGSGSTPSARTDVPALGQVQDAGFNWIAAGGTGDAITAGYSPALTALIDGQLCFVRASAANTLTAPTFSPNGLTARTITKTGGTALVAGDIPAALTEIVLRYNLANTRWELLNPKFPAGSLSGSVRQVVPFETGAVNTGSTVIPYDDTIPQNTEGDQYMSLAITPTNASSTLIIDVVANLSFSLADTGCAVALFQDTTANALAATAWTQHTATALTEVSFRHKMTAGTTSATTFKVRAGAGTAGTTTFNGQAAARFFGGVLASSITITEVLP